MKHTVCDISGMGGREFGGYEWGCQVICARALAFMQKAKTEGQLPDYLEFKNIIGVASPNNAPARELDTFILAHPKLSEYGMTGAMHQYGIGHARKIFEVGREEYLRLCRENGREDDDFYEFDDAEAFPETVPA